MTAKNIAVAILMGSDSDLETMKEAGKILDRFGIGYEMVVASAHRTPDFTVDYVKSAPGRGVKVLIAAAGYAAHLAGVVAAHTILPVIGVPLPASSLGGLDSLLATVQMPGGVPVATVAIGGAKNAALLAAEILALSNEALAKKLLDYRRETALNVQEKNKNLK